ncbi:hypothetical protein HU200_067543 [Digitaria exilis]|uniref:Uncharacterized protein n=1 Tax=Digitaria exilis TaxID=1010633 RepID=A0A834ZW03_9POAL|nr:hypothetical protein HU200_067543 [Digitaria exilis]CAB3489092.1 unnamed protein product [Digitaria exilis]
MVSASSLLLPSSIRDLASCVSDGAVRVACTTPASTLVASSAASSSSSPATLSVTTTYHARTSPPLLFRLTWAHSPIGPPTLSFSAGPTAASPAILLRRRKGSRSLPSDSDDGEQRHPPLALFWDLTAAKYAPAASALSSPEPVSGFYLVAVANAEVVLAVGDLAGEFVKAKFEGQISKAPFAAVARADRVVAAPNAMHAARVRFAEGAPEHEVTVGCATTASGAGGEELWVSVDGKRAVHARRLRWNFRGNQTVFVDGAPVDVMWDLHGWWFRDPPGCAVVMLRARSALESRLWLEEEVAAPVFALVVQAYKTPP